MKSFLWCPQCGDIIKYMPGHAVVEQLFTDGGVHVHDTGIWCLKRITRQEAEYVIQRGVGHLVKIDEDYLLTDKESYMLLNGFVNWNDELQTLLQEGA